MDYSIYVIYDARSNRYTMPMCYDNDPTAIRDFVTEASRPYTRTHEFPEDYILYNIGRYNELTGISINRKKSIKSKLNLWISNSFLSSW